jgi:hypothetical protein
MTVRAKCLEHERDEADQELIKMMRRMLTLMLRCGHN